jgi:hypothetical protein
MADTTREGKTMAYVDSMRCLIDAGTEAGMLIGLENTNNLTALHQRIFGGPLANDIASAGYPGGIEVPWMVEELFVYSLAELSDRQAGYRYDANTNAPSVNWDCDRYVLADWGATQLASGPMELFATRATVTAIGRTFPLQPIYPLSSSCWQHGCATSSSSREAICSTTISRSLKIRAMLLQASS